MITADEAITAAVAATDGTPRSWKLERGDPARIVFEVSVIASGGDDRDVYVDAQSGQTVEVDD
ncbi:PepSY domain-containing protein [Microbacterium bandirmense]|uniref:PepSY domain-containing protein n=1 Tax=Microbacterium bandirmense TaxID=3122050 RepID=UPI003B283520